MKFASCRINDGKMLVSSFSKEYNKTIFEKMFYATFDEMKEMIKDFDHIDFVVPGKDIFFFSRNYPPVNENQLKKIVAQDIESDTTFREADMIIELKTSPLEPSKVFCIQKEVVKKYLSNFDQPGKEKIRSIIPEEYLAFQCHRNLEKAIIVGDDYSCFISGSGKIVKNIGISSLKKELITFFSGETPDEDFEKWLQTGVDISSGAELSDVELRIRKAITVFFEKLIEKFIPFNENFAPVSIIINDILPEGTDKIITMIDSSPFSEPPFNVITASQTLEMAARVPDRGNYVNFAKGEFAYKGGFHFLKKRIIAGAALYFAAIIFLVAGMQMRISYLNKRTEDIDQRTKTVMKEVLGREYPSLRQAISVMNQTIQGEQGAADRRAVYPYSALSIMEGIFPLIAYEGSSIEISELSIREEGKIRIAGTADNLDDINKLSDNLNENELISEISRGQINTRGDKSSFNITFEYAQPRKAESKSAKSRKKGSN